MHGLSKIKLGLATYFETHRAIKRQYDIGQINKVRNTRLQNLIRYCFDNIKYYKEVFRQAGIKPDQIKTVDDLQCLPFLTKDELRNRFWDFLPNELPACRMSRTSGSTGIPVCILSDTRSRCFNSAAVIRCRKALGIPLIGRPILTVLNTKDETERNTHWTYVQGVHRTYYINPHINSSANVQYVKQIVTKLKKPVLTGITPALRVLANQIKDGVFPNFRPSVIMSGGETLSPEVRKLLESVFGIKVADIYACHEARDIAWQCKQNNGYHINADNIVVEVIKDGSPAPCGEVGEIVITDLNRYVMPIIRYKIGDLVRLSDESCPCGCKLPLIAEILGRSGDDIFLPDGKRVAWNQLKSQMTHQNIRQFQLVQQSDGSLTIRYVPEDSANTEQIEALLLNRFKDLIGNSIEIRFEIPQSIPPAPSGKSKLVVSHYKLT